MEEMPLYVSAEQASKIVGCGIHAMYDFMNSSDPPPFLRIGNKRLLQRKGLEAYFIRKQEVKA
jgi:hypothetical protein